MRALILVLLALFVAVRFSFAAIDTALETAQANTLRHNVNLNTTGE